MDAVRDSSSSAPFHSDYRAAGVLLHVTALPGAFGIGDVGPAAYAWVDRLVAAGQTWWQVLPLGPTGSRHSPYEPRSTFAGNTLLISPERLVEEGLLERGDLGETSFPADFVDYEQVVPYKQLLIRKACERFRAGARGDLRGDYDYFCQRHATWLDDFALFLALKERFGPACYTQWPAELARHEESALASVRRELQEPIEIARIGQYLIYRQWHTLRDYARDRGLRLMGDLPIFVSMDSSDAWAHRELFLLDENCQPLALSGVPPDYFSQHGQLWGNPLYDWDRLRQTEYFWWVERLRMQLEWLDLVRLDHFRGFEAAWHVHAGAKTAVEGEWRPGPGADFFATLERKLGGLPFVAEDLGMITDPVRALRDQFHLPGMRVLQFAFEGDPTNPFLPHNYEPNTVVYTGTHDNDTSRGWYESLSDAQRWHVDAYLDRQPGENREIAWQLMRLAWLSVGALAIAPLQDLHNLDASARFNTPGVPDGNWRWRAPADPLPDWLIERLRNLTTLANRRPSGNCPYMTGRKG